MIGRQEHCGEQGREGGQRRKCWETLSVAERGGKCSGELWWLPHHAAPTSETPQTVTPLRTNQHNTANTSARASRPYSLTPAILVRLLIRLSPTEAAATTSHLPLLVHHHRPSAMNVWSQVGALSGGTQRVTHTLPASPCTNQPHTLTLVLVACTRYLSAAAVALGAFGAHGLKVIRQPLPLPRSVGSTQWRHSMVCTYPTPAHRIPVGVMVVASEPCQGPAAAQHVEHSRSVPLGSLFAADSHSAPLRRLPHIFHSPAVGRHSAIQRQLVCAGTDRGEAAGCCRPHRRHRTHRRLVRPTLTQSAIR